LAFLQLDEAYALGVAALGGDFLDARAHQRALVGDQHDLVALAHLDGADDAAVALAGLDADHTLAAAAVFGEFLDAGALAVAVLADGKNVGALLRDDHVHHAVVILEADAAHAAGGAAHGTHVVLVEA